MSRMAEQQLYINGGYTSATSGRTFETLNPANGEVLASVQAAGREDVDRAVESAKRGQKIWAAMTAMERSRVLRRAVDILRERNDELAKLETLDTGKAYSETSTVDIVTGADVLEYYAGLIPALFSVGQRSFMVGGVRVERGSELDGIRMALYPSAGEEYAPQPTPARIAAPTQGRSGVAGIVTGLPAISATI